MVYILIGCKICKPHAYLLVVSGSITIKAVKTATNTNHRANRLVFQAGNGTKSAPLLTFTRFEIKKE